MRFTTWLSSFLLLALHATAAPAADDNSVHRDDLTAWLEADRDAEPPWSDGTVLKEEELEALRPFVPPGVLEEHQFPGARFTIQATRDYPDHTSYQKATLQFSAQTSIGPDGELENYVAGLPFSIERIEAAPPDQGGLMVGWNTVYRWQYRGFQTDPVSMHFLSPGEEEGSGGDPMAPNPGGVDDVLLGGGKVERLLSMVYRRVYFRHLATLADQDYELRNAGGEGLLYKDSAEIIAPFDMKGTRFVIERSNDAHEEDQVNSYLPTQRRVRRLSAKEKADSFLGTELNFDDFEGFTGRVLDYNWTYIGRKRIFTVVDSQQRPRPRHYGPKSRVPLDHWQLRDCLVVEQRPRWEGHPYGSRLIFVDPQTYNIGTTLIFDREGALLKTLQVVYQWPGGEDAQAAPESVVSHLRSMAMINVQTNVTSIAVGGETTFVPLSVSQVRRLFSVSSLTGGR